MKKMKVGDSVVLTNQNAWGDFPRIGLVLGFEYGRVLVFWGTDYGCEPEYPEQLLVV